MMTQCWLEDGYGIEATMMTQCWLEDGHDIEAIMMTQSAGWMMGMV